MHTLALAILLLATPALVGVTGSARAMTAEELETTCRKVDVLTKSDSDLVPFEFMKAYATTQRCLGFVEGFMSAVGVAQVLNPKAMPFCQPKKGISLDQARRIFLKYIAGHPEDMHVTAQTILTVALREVFPCDRP